LKEKVVQGEVIGKDIRDKLKELQQPIENVPGDKLPPWNLSADEAGDKNVAERKLQEFVRHLEEKAGPPQQNAPRDIENEGAAFVAGVGSGICLKGIPFLMNPSQVCFFSLPFLD